MSWTPCDAPCGGGTRERNRECNNPPPQNGGEDCVDDDSETENCNEDPCPGNSHSDYSALM